MSRKVHETNKKKFLLVSQYRWINPCHGEVKTSFDALYLIDSGKNTKNDLPLSFKGYSDIKPHLLSEHNHQIILDKIETRENLNHDEYVENESYYNVYSDDSDDDYS